MSQMIEKPACIAFGVDNLIHKSCAHASQIPPLIDMMIMMMSACALGLRPLPHQSIVTAPLGSIEKFLFLQDVVKNNGQLDMVQVTSDLLTGKEIEVRMTSHPLFLLSPALLRSFCEGSRLLLLCHTILENL